MAVEKGKWYLDTGVIAENKKFRINQHGEGFSISGENIGDDTIRFPCREGNRHTFTEGIGISIQKHSVQLSDEEGLDLSRKRVHKAKIILHTELLELNYGDLTKTERRLFHLLEPYVKNKEVANAARS